MYLCCVQCNSVTKKRIVVVNAYAKMWTFGWLKCVFSEPTAHWAPFISTENALNNNDVAMCSIVNGIYQPQTSFRWTLPSNRRALVFSLFRSFSVCVSLWTDPTMVSKISNKAIFILRYSCWPFYSSFFFSFHWVVWCAMLLCALWRHNTQNRINYHQFNALAGF